MGEELKSWGDGRGGLDDSVVRSVDLDCPNCNWSPMACYKTTGEPWHRHIVGFTTDCPPSQTLALKMFGFGYDVKERLGAVIIECPQCFSKFWFHLTEDGLEYCKKWCPQWPGYQPEKEEE